MGRIKTSFIKHIGREIFDKHKEKFTEDFSHNKETLKQVIDIKSKKLHNIVAGYVTNLKKQKAE